MASLLFTGFALLMVTMLLSSWSIWLSERPGVSPRWEAAPRFVLPAVLVPVVGAAYLIGEVHEALDPAQMAAALRDARLLTGLAAVLVATFLTVLTARTAVYFRLVALTTRAVRRLGGATDSERR